jgi:formate dehydrogenase subunit gamma
MRSGYRRRFSRTERTLHWANAVFFLFLLATGLILYLPSLAADVGRRPLVQSVHFWSGVAWVGVLAAIVVLGDRRGLRRTARELDGFDRDDLRWLLGRRPAPQGRFNAGQKLNTALTAAFTVLFLVSGLLLWFGERDTRYRFASTVVVHDGLMYVSLALLVGHLYLAVLHPATRHALRGITVGTVSEDWAARHHPKWSGDETWVNPRFPHEPAPSGSNVGERGAPPAGRSPAPAATADDPAEPVTRR